MSNLPYVVSPGNVPRALDAIIAAATPEKVSQNFVKTILKIPGGSGDQMTTFLKKVEFADTSGSPTRIYKKFRNPAERGWAAAECLRRGYSTLYRKNEFLHELPDKDLRGLILEETGLSSDSKGPDYILSCFKSIKKYADFSVVSEGVGEDLILEVPSNAAVDLPERQPSSDAYAVRPSATSVGLSVGYNINLNLPATSDPAVFNAIFKSLKEHLLKNENG